VITYNYLRTTINEQLPLCTAAIFCWLRQIDFRLYGGAIGYLLERKLVIAANLGRQRQLLPP
jgi:hypothetical protein